jgi:bifunctional DNA-binding transcriptional regulator/antitoxin component of YhaV-PrlF toxin-antitoxin module
MFAESTLTAKNQTTVPKAIVDALGLKPSAKLLFELTDDGQLLVHVKQGRLADLAGFLSKRSRKRKTPVSLEEMDAAIRRAAGDSYLKSIGETRESFARRRKSRTH